MSTPLTGQAEVVHDNMVSVASAMQTLLTNATNAQSAIAGSGDSNAIAAINGLLSALPSSVTDPVKYIAEGYEGAQQTNGT